MLGEEEAGQALYLLITFMPKGEETMSSKELAEAHWKWLETLLHKIYVDAFIHGMKHGEETKNEAGSDQ